MDFLQTCNGWNITCHRHLYETADHLAFAARDNGIYIGSCMKLQIILHLQREITGYI